MVGQDERHVPVLLQDAIQYLNVQPGGTYVDATLGMAGHSSAIARLLGKSGKLIAFDRDPEAMAIAKANLARLSDELGEEMPTLELIDEEFSTASEKLEAASVDGILADFGISSMQLSEAHRGFSFQADGPLDMRMDKNSYISAYELVNSLSEKEISNILKNFGEERFHHRIANERHVGKLESLLFFKCVGDSASDVVHLRHIAIMDSVHVRRRPDAIQHVFGHLDEQVAHLENFVLRRRIFFHEVARPDVLQARFDARR